MDPTIQSLHYLKPPASSPKAQRDYIAIRSLSYQKNISEAKLQENFFRTSNDGFLAKPTLTQYQHKLNKNRNNLIYSSGGTGSQMASLKTLATLKNSNTRLRNKTTFNFDSINYNKMIRKSDAPAFFTNFMTGKSPSALLHPPYEVPDDQTIQENYRFKLPVIVSGMENDNIYINLLMAFPHSNDFIIGLIEDAKKCSRQLEAQKMELKNEMEAMKQKTEDELNEHSDFFRKEFERLHLKEDFVKNQNENFRLQKEITLLLRDKTNLETDIETTLERIKKLEMEIYKVEMYDLKIDDPFVQTLNMRNLREEHTQFLQTTHIFH